MRADGAVGFEVAAYKAGTPLVIDPVLDYATYLGGGWRDEGVALALAEPGNLSLAGTAVSADFPVVNALQPVHGGIKVDALERWVARGGERWWFGG